MATLNQKGSTQFSLAMTDPGALLGIGLGLACLLWLLGALVFFGLPAYYRQAPGQVPTFYLSLFRRRIILVRLFQPSLKVILILMFFCFFFVFCSGFSTWCSYQTTGYRHRTDETGCISGPASTHRCGKLSSLSYSFSLLSGRQLSGFSTSFPRDTPGSSLSLPSVLVLPDGLRSCGQPPT